MPQDLSQHQLQTEQQQLRLSPQQLLTVKLLELSLLDLEKRVNDEVLDNITLEEDYSRIHSNKDDSEHDDRDTSDGNSSGDEDTFVPEGDQDEIQNNEPTDNSDNYDTDDDQAYSYRGENEGAEKPIGSTTSFIDDLNAQIADFDLDEHQQQLVEYLIGSLNEKGFIDVSLGTMVDDLAIYYYIDTSKAELEQMLQILQQFDPPGIGARSTQECLLLQLQRADSTDNGKQPSSNDLARQIIENHYDDFVNQRNETLMRKLSTDSIQLSAALDIIRHLNPYPGTALSESAADRVQTIIPDFIIETTPDGEISVTLNCGKLPELHISKEYIAQIEAYKKRSGKLSRLEHEAFTYAQQKVESARQFIAAMCQRQNTLKTTIQTIIQYQRDFILTQDESRLVPMRLTDIAKHLNIDISTISRVRTSKYVQIDGTTYPLSIFFKRAHTNAQGENIEQDNVCDTIRQLINTEDKANPLSDAQIVEKLKGQNINISRRTVAKYRGIMGIPTAKNRKD